MNDAPPAPHARLEPLGIALMLLGAADLLWGLVVITANVLQAAGVLDRPYTDTDVSSARETGRHIGEMMALVASLGAWPVGVVTLFAGYKLRRAETYALALAASMLNMFPCYQTTCCALFGFPIGVWALVTLMSADVKATFR